MLNMFDEWQPESFYRLCYNIKKLCKKKRVTDIQGYNLTKMKEIYLFIAHVVLEGLEYSDQSVRDWTREGNHGPSIYREDARERMCEFFYGTKKIIDRKENDDNMDKEYSDFVKERVFKVHQAIVNYLSVDEDENEFWKMESVFDVNRVAISDDISVKIESFITQYLEAHLFGRVMRKDREGEVDLSHYRERKLKEWNNLKDMPDLQEWFQLRNLYDLFAEDYIKLVLQG